MRGEEWRWTEARRRISSASFFDRCNARLAGNGIGDADCGVFQYIEFVNTNIEQVLAHETWRLRKEPECPSISEQELSCAAWRCICISHVARCTPSSVAQLHSSRVTPHAIPGRFPSAGLGSPQKTYSQQSWLHVRSLEVDYVHSALCDPVALCTPSCR